MMRLLCSPPFPFLSSCHWTSFLKLPANYNAFISSNFPTRFSCSPIYSHIHPHSRSHFHSLTNCSIRSSLSLLSLSSSSSSSSLCFSSSFCFSFFGRCFSSFGSFGLSDDLLNGLQHLHISNPTSIQSVSIPLILQGTNIHIAEQTGQGKVSTKSSNSDTTSDFRYIALSDRLESFIGSV